MATSVDTAPADGLNFHTRRLWRTVFAVSFLLRAYFSFKLSYLHPDEHLQGPQVVAREYFGWAAQDVWDFKGPYAVRSHVPLWLIYGLPMSMFAENADPTRVLYTIRSVVAVLTWILTDMAVDRLSRNRTEQLRGLLFVSTSYVTWVYQSRTLSNSFETILVLWFLVIIHEFKYSRVSVFDRQFDCLMLAAIVMLGVFNRPSFVVWMFLPSFSLLPFFWKFKLSFITFIIGLAASGMLFVYVDTLLYGADDWVIAPLNNLLYNTNRTSLSDHGLHPHWTHLLVNLPELLGPGLLLLRPQWSTLPMQSAVSGVVLLSLIPHQESRFLVPIIPLLCMNMDISHFQSNVKRILIFVWLLFNVLAGAFMGAYHQGGVVPAQQFIRSLELPNTIVWWKTYPPPLWLLGLNRNHVSFTSTLDTSPADIAVKSSNLHTSLLQPSMAVVDLQGSNTEEAALVLRSVPRPFYFVAPLASQHKNLTKDAEMVWSTNEHWTLDLYDIFRPSSFEPGLSVWRIS